MGDSTHQAGPFYWLGWFLLYFVIVVGFLALTAAVIFMLVGAMTNPDLPVWQRGWQGLRNGAELGAKVWAPAISLVLCVMKAHRHHQAREASDDEI